MSDRDETSQPSATAREADLELSRQVCAIVADVCEVEQDLVTLDTPFSDYPVDSLRLEELAAALEDTFAIDIPSDVAKRMTSVRAVVLEIAAAHAAADGDQDSPGRRPLPSVPWSGLQHTESRASGRSDGA
jgi:acyl carrier protein